MNWTPFSSVAPAGNAAALAAQAGINLRTLVAHPFVAGLGEGRGNYRYLSFPNAVQALSRSLLNEEHAVFGMAAAGSSYGAFATQLHALTSVFPIRQFSQVRNRALRLSTLETDKYNLPPAPDLLAGGSMALKSLPLVADLQKAALTENALALAGSFAGTDPLDNLDAFAIEKTASDTLVNGALAGVKSACAGATGYRFYAASNAASAILDGLGSEFTLTSIMLFIGSPSELALLREMAP